MSVLVSANIESTIVSETNRKLVILTQSIGSDPISSFNYLAFITSTYYPLLRMEAMEKVHKVL